MTLVEIISQDVELKRQGRELKGPCPFHAEIVPSFTVSEEKGLYHCYGCGKGGDSITYLREKRGCSFKEAARIAGKVLPEDDLERARRFREAREKVLERFYTWKHEKLEVLNNLQHDVWVASVACRAACRAPHLWPEDERNAWTDRYWDAAHALARFDTKRLLDDQACWGWWREQTGNP